MPVYTILHTNDFHNKLTQDQVKKLAERRHALGDTGLLLDAGDAISAGNITYHANGEPILKQMSDAGYDAMTTGNREFHFSRAGFTAKVKNAAFPVLCANVRSREQNSVPPVLPHTSFKLSGGFRVTVFGLTVAMITEKMLSSRISAFVFDDPVATGVKLATELKPDCDLLVCLSHMGLKRDKELAANCHGIDLVVGGHTHAVLDEGEMVESTLIAQAGSWGRYLGIVTIVEENDGRHITAGLEPL